MGPRMPPPMTRVELNEGRCMVSGCKEPHRHDDIVFFHARCHPKEGMRVAYVFSEGVLDIRCICGQPVVRILAAKAPDTLIIPSKEVP